MVLSKELFDSPFKREILMEALQDIKVKYEDLSKTATDNVDKFMYNDLTRYVDQMINNLVV